MFTAISTACLSLSAFIELRWKRVSLRIRNTSEKLDARPRVSRVTDPQRSISRLQRSRPRELFHLPPSLRLFNPFLLLAFFLLSHFILRLSRECIADASRWGDLYRDTGLQLRGQRES